MEAVKWWHMAADQGHPYAQSNLQRLSEQLPRSTAGRAAQVTEGRRRLIRALRSCRMIVVCMCGSRMMGLSVRVHNLNLNKNLVRLMNSEEFGAAMAHYSCPAD